jgi:hypothetical protein
MHVAYLLFFLCFPLLVKATPPKIEVMPAPKSLEDYEHEFKGCPENSECDQVMGLGLQKWKELTTKLEDDKASEAKKAQQIENFREKYGLPVEFYTLKKSQQGYKPLLFNSACTEHNPKDPKQSKILRGVAFIKSLSKERAIIWRDQTEIQVPVGELLSPQPVTVYLPSGAVTYELPLEDEPLFIKGGLVHVLKEEDNLFFFLAISANGEWKVVENQVSQLSLWESHKQIIECPKDQVQAPKVFNYSSCKTIWNEDLKKTVVMKLNKGCFN